MLICGHCGGLVKSLSDLAVHLRCEEKPLPLVVVENTDAQQLKAEIAASLDKFLSCQDELKYDEALGDFIERMRQLSAV